MKFVSTAGKVASSLHSIIGIVNKRCVVRGLSNVRLMIKGNFLELLTTDLEVSISVTLEVDGGESDLCIFVDATIFYDALRKIKSEASVLFFVQANRLSIISGAVKFLIPFVTDNCFFGIDDTEKKYSIVLPVRDAINFFEKTRCAIALENTRINLTGIFFHSQDGVLCSVATDCNRLAYANSNLCFEENFGIIIPRKAIVELNKLISKSKPDDLYVVICGRDQIGTVVFNFAKIKIATKLIVGQFPNYGKVIPKQSTVCLKFNTKNIIEVIERVSVIALERNRAIKFCIFSNNQVKIYMNTVDGGFAEEIVYVEIPEFIEEIEIAMNYNYLLDSLYQIDGDLLTIKVINNSSAVLIEDTSNNNVGYVIMPMVG